MPAMSGQVIKNCDWLPPGSTMELIQTKVLPDPKLITSVHIFCFSGDKLLLIKHDARGWDIPGGHVEVSRDSTIEDALHRELLEEACCSAVDLQPIAQLKITVKNPPQNYMYPVPTSFIVAFIGKLEKEFNFSAEFESSDRGWFSLEQVKQLPFYQAHRELVELVFGRLALA